MAAALGEIFTGKADLSKENIVHYMYMVIFSTRCRAELVQIYNLRIIRSHRQAHHQSIMSQHNALRPHI